MPKKEVNIMINHLDDVRALLRVWADWVNTGTGQNLSYPKSSAFIHADEGRETCVASDSNDVAEKIERTMCLLKSISPMLFKCLLCEYLYQYTNQQACDYLKIADKTYRIKRKEAEHFIAGSFA